MMSLSTVTSSVIGTVPTSAVAPLTSLETRSTNIDEWEKERTALYQQLDEKVNRTMGWRKRNIPLV